MLDKKRRKDQLSLESHESNLFCKSFLWGPDSHVTTATVLAHKERQPHNLKLLFHPTCRTLEQCEKTPHKYWNKASHISQIAINLTCIMFLCCSLQTNTYCTVCCSACSCFQCHFELCSTSRGNLSHTTL